MTINPYGVPAPVAGPRRQQRFREAGLWAVDSDSYYRGRFQEETACLRVAARRKRETDKGPSPESKYFKPLARFSKRKVQSRG